MKELSICQTETDSRVPERGMTLVRASGSHSRESARVLSAHPRLLGNGLEGPLSFVLSP